MTASSRFVDLVGFRHVLIFFASLSAPPVPPTRFNFTRTYHVAYTLGFLSLTFVSCSLYFYLLFGFAFDTEDFLPML
jgi:hypothetical protein